MRIIFFGTPPFAAHILDLLIQEGHQVVAVVTRPDRQRGRRQKLLPSAVKALVQEKWPKLPILQPEKASTEEFATVLKELKPDVFVVVAYGEIIKTNLLEIPTKMCVNIHASLLPKYRGAAPIQRVIMNGERESGVTIMEMVLKMDAGDILEMVKVPISEEMNFGELEEVLCKASGPPLLNVLKKIELGTVQKKPQNHEEVTFAAKISLEDRVIDWEKSSLELHNQIRGLSPSPGAFCFVEIGGERKRLGVKKTAKHSHASGKPGETLSYTKKEWVVACGEGALSLLEVQIEGKKALPIEDFIRGHPGRLKFLKPIA